MGCAVANSSGGKSTLKFHALLVHELLRSEKGGSQEFSGELQETELDTEANCYSSSEVKVHVITA